MPCPRTAPVKLLAVAFACSIATVTSAQSPDTHHHRFEDAQQWAKVFDDPQRDAWQKPHEVIAALALKAGALVADIGAGTGYFTMRLAHMLPAGRVYAVDTEPAMVRHVTERALKAGMNNITAVRASGDDARLPQPVDLILLVDVYHHIEHPGGYFERLKPALRRGGRIAIIDFRPESPIGPPRSARIAANQVRTEMERAGYVLARMHDFLPNQYFLEFEVATNRR